MPGGLSLSTGSQRIRHLPDQGNCSRWCRWRSARNLGFPVGQYFGRQGIQTDPGGTTNAGAAYLYQLEANGSATYLTKVTSPGTASLDSLGYSVSLSGDVLAVGAYGVDIGATDAGAVYTFDLSAPEIQTIHLRI